jgi:hypothetical protein
MTATVSPTAVANAQRTTRQPSALELLRQPPVTPLAPAPQLPDLPPPVAPGFRFSREQAAALAAPLDRAHVRQREQGRGRVSYLEGWQVIAEANRIFGFDGWQRQTVLLRCVAERPRKIGSEPRRPIDPPQRDGWGVTYIAKVRIAVGDLLREGTGAGHGIDVDLGLAHESALKEAETDATKRALMTFGNPFGLALYDKQQRQVSGTTAQKDRSQAEHTQPGQRQPDSLQPSSTQVPRHSVVRRLAVPNPVAAAFNGPPRTTNGAATPAPDAPLDPATIGSLHERIRALPPPQLAAFTQAFRRAFQVPAETPSIAGLITQQRHRLWTQDYLGRLQSQHQQARTA